MSVFIRKPIFVYILLFLLIEAILLLYIANSGQPFMIVTPDGELYFNMAENLVGGNGLINQVRKEYIIVPPLFSIILAPFAMIGSMSAFIIFQYILYGMNGLLLYIIANKLFRQSTIGLICTLLYAIHPVLLLNGPQYLLTETIFITFILFIVYLGIGFIREEKKENRLLTIVLLMSLSLLFRPHLLYVFVLIGLLWLVFFLKKKISLRSAFVFVIPIVFLVTNGLYNAMLHGEFVLLENYSGQNLYIANNPETEVAFYASTLIEEFVEPEYFNYSDISLSEKSQILREKAVSYILSNPLEMIKRSIMKMGLFFKGIYPVDWFILFLFFIGILLSFKKERQLRLELLFILLFILGFAALTSLGLLVEGQRYRAPIIPIYLLFSGYALYFFLTGIWFQLKIK